MKGKATFGWGIALAAVGLLGLGALWVASLNGASITGDGAFTSAGQRIYYTGQDAGGSRIPRSGGLGMMASAGCVDCHGEDGRGGDIDMMMLGPVEVPDIRYSALTSPHSEEETAQPAWSEADIKRAIRDGIEPDGERLKAPMPRWNMTDAELEDVIAYLKELDGP